MTSVGRCILEVGGRVEYRPPGQAPDGAKPASGAKLACAKRANYLDPAPRSPPSGIPRRPVTVTGSTVISEFSLSHSTLPALHMH
jgi:hypothetical protein